MKKHYFFLIVLFFLFNGCVERGDTLKIINKNDIMQTQVGCLQNIAPNTTENKISSMFIIAIGIMILL